MSSTSRTTKTTRRSEMVPLVPLAVNIIRSPVGRWAGRAIATCAIRALSDENIRGQIKNFIVPKIAGTFSSVTVPAEVEEYDPYLC